MDSVVEDLQNAKRELQTHGWSQGHFMDKDGHLCALGAIRCALVGHHAVDRVPLAGPFASTEDNVQLWDRYLAAAQALDDHLPYVGTTVPTYNDAATTTQQDILNLFDKALADLGGLS